MDGLGALNPLLEAALTLHLDTHWWEAAYSGLPVRVKYPGQLCPGADYDISGSQLADIIEMPRESARKLAITGYAVSRSLLLITRIEVRQTGFKDNYTYSIASAEIIRHHNGRPPIFKGQL